MTYFHAAMQRAGPRQSREQLLDRYHSHTQHCKACSGALRNVERGLQLSLWGGGLMTFAAAVYAAVALSGGAVPSTLSSCTAGQGGALGAAGRFLLSMAVRTLPAGAYCVHALRGLYLPPRRCSDAEALSVQGIQGRSWRPLLCSSRLQSALQRSMEHCSG